MASEVFHCITPIKIRFRDLDALGHVNNSVYFTFMEMARMDYFTQIGFLKNGEFPAPFFIIAEAACQFKVPIQMDTSLTIKTRVNRLGNSSFDMEYHFGDETAGQLLAIGRTVQVVFDYTTNRSVALPDEWRAAIAQLENL